MNTLIQKFLALFSSTRQDHPTSPGTPFELGGMPLASATYLREFAQRLGLEVDDLSSAEQAELKNRLDASMDFREDNYGFLYHEVYQLGHGYSLADATRVSAQINDISEEQSARAYLDYRENAVAAEALMAAGALLQKEGDEVAAQRLFGLADARRHRSSQLAVNVENMRAQEAGLEGLMEDSGKAAAETEADAKAAAETEADAKADKPAE